MTLYTKYCARKLDRKGQGAPEMACCPSRIPIIGLIIVCLFIFSPFIFGTSNTKNPSEVQSDPNLREPSYLDQNVHEKILVKPSDQRTP